MRCGRMQTSGQCGDRATHVVRQRKAMTPQGSEPSVFFYCERHARELVREYPKLYYMRRLHRNCEWYPSDVPSDRCSRAARCMVVSDEAGRVYNGWLMCMQCGSAIAYPGSGYRLVPMPARR